MSSVFESAKGLFRSAPSAVAQDVSNQIFCVTGGYGGLGAETVRTLMRAGAKKVIVGGRNTKLQEEFVESLKKDETESVKVDDVIDASHTIDLGDLESVKEFALYIRQTYPVIDVLICNAGVMNTPLEATKQGFEQQMGVNVIGHFLLAKILVEVTKRQVWVSSFGHSIKGGKRIDIDSLKNFSLEKTEIYDGWLAYQQSKLGNILLAKEFQKRYETLEAVSLHPGTIYTSLYRDTGIVSALKVSASMIPAVFRGDLLQLIPKRPSAGAATTIACSTFPSGELTNGGYYSNCCLARETEAAKNEQDAKDLFDYCDEITKKFQ